MNQDYIKKLIEDLNNASVAYYNGKEIMSNVTWDEKFDELKRLEEETGFRFPESPTNRVGSLPKIGTKITHEFPAKSLDKTKDSDLLARKMKSEEAALIMWKLDGGTLQLTYEGGRMRICATRGNGEVGQDITANASGIIGIPGEIPYKGKLVVRGEALMSYEDFYNINAALSDDEQYANPRNLANATVSMLDPTVVRDRKIHFKAFGIVYIEEEIPRFNKRMEWLVSQGFDPVEWELVSPDKIPEAIERISLTIGDYPYPVDGLVVASNEIGRAEKLPGTGHHPNVLAGYAFKWADTEAKTVLREIEWSASRTGLLNPVAIFDPVELEGTTVSRASLHNVSYIMEKHLHISDEITVYKANMIIPQIKDNLSEDSREQNSKEEFWFEPVCPVCGTKASLSLVNDVYTMRCQNPHCDAKKIGSFVHFCSRDCMDIEGMSEATITKFVEKGFIHKLDDFYNLDRFRDEIIGMEGFGEKSYSNLSDAIEKSRTRDIASFLNSIGIANVGKGQAKQIVLYFNGKAKDVIENIFENPDFDFSVIDGIGEVINNSIHEYANAIKKNNGGILGSVLKELNLSDIEVPKTDGSPISGKIFVITGNVNHYANRNELKAEIESLGGKVTGSVTSKTDYLINNDSTSTSGKNKKAKELNIPIITEDEYLNLIKEKGE